MPELVSDELQDAWRDAVRVVTKVPSWTLPKAGWDRVEQAVEALGVAVESSEPRGIFDAVGQLMMLDPHRVGTKLGDDDPKDQDPPVGPPPAVRDGIGALVHSIGVGHRSEVAGSADGGDSE